MLARLVSGDAELHSKSFHEAKFLALSSPNESNRGSYDLVLEAIVDCLQADASKRPTALELRRMLGQRATLCDLSPLFALKPSKPQRKARSNKKTAGTRSNSPKRIGKVKQTTLESDADSTKLETRT